MLVSTYVVVVAINHYNLASLLVLLCPFPRMLFGDPRIVFIVIPSFLCISVVAPYPCAPNVLLWAQLLLKHVVFVVVNHNPVLSFSSLLIYYPFSLDS